MSALSSTIDLPRRLGAWLDDRMNPIVVKELRQSVKSRFVVAVLMLLLLVLLISLVVTLLNLDARDFDDETGAGLFMVFQSILLATCMLFVPVYVGVRLAAERATATSDLLYVTTIRPSSIVWGKLLAGMVVTALAFSACVPFMTITFLLRGIDPPTNVFILFLDALIVLAATQLAIFVATMPLGWPVKALLGLVLLGLSFGGFVGMTSWVGMALLGFGIGSVLDSSDFWIGMSIGIGSWLAAVAMLFFLSVAIISPPTANRALVPRLYFTFVVFATLAGFLYLTFRFMDNDGLEIWLYFALPVFALTAIISASEREAWGPRLRRSIPRWRLMRLPAFLFYSGAAGGLIWSAGLYAVSLLVIGAGLAALELGWFEFLSAGSRHSYYGSFIDDWAQRFASVGFWLYGYLLLAVLFCRRLLKFKNGPAVTGVVGLCLMAAASIIPMVIAYAIDPDRWDFKVELWLTLNPFGPVMCSNSDWGGTYGTIALPLSAVFFTVMVLISIPWFARQMANFRPLPAAAIEPPKVDTPPPSDLAVAATEEAAEEAEPDTERRDG